MDIRWILESAASRCFKRFGHVDNGRKPEPKLQQDIHELPDVADKNVQHPEDDPEAEGEQHLNDQHRNDFKENHAREIARNDQKQHEQTKNDQEVNERRSSDDDW